MKFPDVCSRLARRYDERLEEVCDGLGRLYFSRLLQRVRVNAGMELVRRSAAARPGGELLADIRAEYVVWSDYKSRRDGQPRPRAGLERSDHHSQRVRP